MARKWRKVSPEDARSHPLYGVKNWLAVFAFAVLLVPLREFGSLNAEAQSMGMTIGELLDVNVALKTWVSLVLATEVAFTASIFWLLYSKSPHFRVAASTLLIALFPVFALFALLTDAPGAAQFVVLGLIPWAISCLLWVTYLQRSRRVRVTFEHCVLAENAVSPVVAPAQVPTQAPEPDAALVPKAPSTPTALGTQQIDSRSTLIAVADVSPAASERVASAGVAEDDERLWAQALVEFNGEGRKQGLWAKAFAQSSGNESAAQAQYLSDRVMQLSDERATDIRAEAARLNERQRSEAQAREDVAKRTAALRADFVSGKRLSPEDVSLLVKTVEFDPGLLMLTDRYRGESLLHWTARHGLHAETTALISNGANVGAPNGDGRKPHELTKDLELIAILRRAAGDGHPA